MPEVGKGLSIEDVEMLLNALETRSTNFPEESFDLTFALVMLNIGQRFTSVSCINGEWVGQKKDVPKGDDVPKCPNGHVLMEGVGIQLGWIFSE
jgi:hypothetical protein